VPFFRAGDEFPRVSDKLVEVHRAATVFLVIAVPANEVAGKHPGDLPAALEAPPLSDVMPGFTEGGEVLGAGAGSDFYHEPT